MTKNTTMTKTINGNCIRCEQEVAIEYFMKYDDEMEAGICVGCEDQIKRPSQKHIDRVMGVGTPAQIAVLESKIKLQKLQFKLKHGKANFAKNPIIDLKEVSVSYEEILNTYWYYYKKIVCKESNIKPKDILIDGNMQEVLTNYVHWLAGDDMGYDPTKSIYMYSGLGVGKSTIVYAGYLTLKHIRPRWKKRYYDYISMDELFLETYTTASLDGIGRLAKGTWCLDELRERHLKYKHYGNDFYIISDILTARHNLWKRNKTNTIITTNIDSKSLESVLDARLMDRMKQQYTLVKLEGLNKR